MGALTTARARELDLLEASYLRLGEVVIERITVVKFGMNNRGGDSGSCLGIEVWAGASELAGMVIARFGDGENLVRKVLNVRRSRHCEQSVWY